MASEDPAPVATARRSVLDRTVAAGTEIERKYLVPRFPDDLARYPSERITQGYLALDPDGAEVRLRRRGYHTLLTVKQGRGLTRAEEEFLIDGPRFERLWAGTSGRRVEKTRYRVPHGDHVIEVDRYDGSLTGLIVAEVEFASVQDAAAFRAPGWMRADVTGDPRYANARLAVDGLPDRNEVGEHGLLDGEDPTAGLIQVALAQIDAAADALQGRDAEDYGVAVHTARKAFKRARALVRVAREGLGEPVVARDGAALRDAGRRLAGARDAQVVVQTLESLIARHPDELGDAVIGPFHGTLVAEFEAADREARSDEGAVAEVLDLLDRVRADLTEWDLGDDPGDVLAAGFTRIHRHGRKRFRLAEHEVAGDDGGEPKTEALHELRKRAKELWYASELLEVAAPKRMRALAQQTHDLTDHIGDDHDLAVLAAQVQARPEAFTDPAHAATLLTVIERRREKLQRKALRLGSEVYGEKPTRLVERIRERGTH